MIWIWWKLEMGASRSKRNVRILLLGLSWRAQSFWGRMWAHIHHQSNICWLKHTDVFFCSWEPSLPTKLLSFETPNFWPSTKIPLSVFQLSHSSPIQAPQLLPRQSTILAIHPQAYTSSSSTPATAQPTRHLYFRRLLGCRAGASHCMICGLGQMWMARLVGTIRSMSPRMIQLRILSKQRRSYREWIM